MTVTNPLKVNNPPKFYLLVIALVGLFVLVLTHAVSWGDVELYFGIIVGYGVGNGIASAKGQPSEPVFAPSDSNTHTPPKLD